MKNYEKHVAMICDKLIELSKLNNGLFPTLSQMTQLTGDTWLSNQVRTYGGCKFFAEKTHLPYIRTTELGGYFERYCVEELKQAGFDARLSPSCYPYDVLAFPNIKVEVKVSNPRHNGKSVEHQCHLNQALPLFDVLVFYCLDDNGNVLKRYTIPSFMLNTRGDLVIGMNNHKYDFFKDNFFVFNYLKDMNENLAEISKG